MHSIETSTSTAASKTLIKLSKIVNSKNLSIKLALFLACLFFNESFAYLLMGEIASENS
jgi:hypothetical protein